MTEWRMVREKRSQQSGTYQDYLIENTSNIKKRAEQGEFLINKILV